MKTASSTDFQIKRRDDLNFDFSSVPRYWVEGDVFTTHLFNTLSILAPATERLLIKIVKNTENLIKDDKLKQDAIGFIKQEGMHSRAHNQFNNNLIGHGYDMAEINKIIRAAFNNILETHTQEQQVALLAAGEHLIYKFSKMFLNSPGLHKDMHPEIRRLFEWHALEEIEHQSVAIDIYHHLYGNSFKHRLWALPKMLLIVGRTGSKIQNELVQQDSQICASRAKLKFQFNQFFLPAYLSRIVIGSLDFFSPKFTPWSEAKDLSLIKLLEENIYTNNPS